MGRRGFSFPEAVGLLFGTLAFFAAACSTGDGAAGATASPGANHTATPGTATSTVPAPRTPAPPPRIADEVPDALKRLFAESRELCPKALLAEWDVVCAEGDLDGDGKGDAAYLVPLGSGAGRAPAVVAVRMTSAPAIELVERDGLADATGLGRIAFSAADRTGDGRAELIYLATGCTQANCTTRLSVMAWDGTAWRAIGPGESFNNADAVTVDGGGATSRLTVHAAGLRGAASAGPVRASLSVFALKQARFELVSRVADPPVYLFHAIQDADATFDAGDWQGAIAAYRAAIADAKLLDWQKEQGRGDGRGRLTAYALFRVALASAAAGDDPRKALDEVILQEKEPVFASVAEAFRRGFKELSGVQQGCVEVNIYLATPAVADYIKQVFDYGYANPRRTYREICPL